MAEIGFPIAASSQVLTRERSPLRHVDPTLLAATAVLTTYGLLMIYSATQRTLRLFGNDPGLYLKKQATFLVLGVIAMIVATLLDYRLAKVYAAFLYGASLFLLVLVRTPLGTSVKGAQRSFSLMGFQLSPSLLTRLTLVIMLAAFLSEIRGEMTLRDVMRATSIAAIPAFLVFIQPDFGTSMILATVLVALLVISGAKARHLAVLALVAILGFVGALQLGIVKDYQLARLTDVWHSSDDTQTASYNKQQAEIAIGAGGVAGRGYLEGTQTNLDFVPEQNTDFIFTVVGEEFGFVGAMLLLVLYAVVLWRAFRIAGLSKDPFGTLLAIGAAAIIAIQVFVNIGMTIGIMPITGIPLPFISYGGSALVVDLVAIGILQNVHMRRLL
jgi:rod shape determining protein RodA